MTPMETETLAPPTSGTGNYGFRFEVSDVTGTHQSVMDGRDVQRSTPAGAVAQAVAARMDLPQNVPWALRDDASGNYLEDQRAIGEQIESDARLTLTPKTHLGAG